MSMKVTAIVIVGDINLPKINWITMSCPDDNVNRQFLSLAIQSSYSQLVNFPTHDSNILELVLTTDSSIISCVKPDVPFGSSDHDMVTFNVTVANNSSCSIVQDPCCVYNWQNADYDAIEWCLSDFDWYSFVAANPAALALWDAFMSILHDLIDRYVPKYQCRPVTGKKRCSR